MINDEYQDEYGPMVYSDQTQPIVYPTASVRPADDALRAALRQAQDELAKNEADYKVVLDSYADENQQFHDKIDALSAENARLRDEGEMSQFEEDLVEINSVFGAQITWLRAENARLQALLQDVLDWELGGDRLRVIIRETLAK